MTKAGVGVAVAFAALFVAATAAGDVRGLPRDEAFERKIASELRARDPTAADVFAEGTAAYDRGDFEAAASRFAEVRERDPWFVHATRRLCGAEDSRGHRDRALALCREALAADRSPENESALAVVLVQSPSGRPPESQLAEALSLARDAEWRAPSVYTEMALCQCALMAGDAETLPACASRLRNLAPDATATHVFSAFGYATRGQTRDGLRELDVARSQGLADPTYRSMRTVILNAQSPIERGTTFFVRVVVAWLAGLALLLGAAAGLSAVTLRTVDRIPAEPTGRPRGADAALRRAYRVALWVTCAYYYLSLPLVAVLVVVLAAGALYACLALGRIPIKLVLLGAVIVAGSLWAIAKSLFVRAREEEPGEKIDFAEHPRLRGVLDEVAERIGTRPVDAVYLTPGADVAVFERGGMMAQLRGRSERCLVLGAAALDGMRVRELKAILAHEYGHFHNEDTAGGGFALAVRRSMMTMAVHLARSGAASVLNPAWWFVRGFYAVFLRVSQGASRLQEVLADRWAAFAYGSEAFAHGLKHIVERSIAFDAHLSATLAQVVPNKEPLANLYAFTPKQPRAVEDLAKAVDTAMNRPAAPTDSHPRPADRIAWVTRLAAPERHAGEDDARDAWDLLGAREVFEERMTERVRTRLRARGIRLVAPETPDPSSPASVPANDGAPNG